ncbi:MAG: CDP-archaeol synthase [Clostridia bacterium]|nr:CDP-archaeol synthase [Clostridia bacterium]
MKTRVISGIVIGVLLVGAYCLMFTPVIDLVFSLLAAAACFEVTKVAGVKNLALRVVAIVFAGLLPLGVVYIANLRLLEVFVILYVILLIILTVANFSKTTITFPELAVTVYASLVIPAAFASIGLISDMYLRYPDLISKADCRLLLWITVATALFTDVFAYFTGVKFGKTKMAPNLSPKKSWEGAIGGVVGVLLFMLLSLLLFEKVFAKTPFFMPVWFYCITVVFISITSMFGDLMASLIKRYYGVKDYSNLIPGHGGIMDRFDSVILASPTMFALITIYGMVA